jgi:hypothetical protein
MTLYTSSIPRLAWFSPSEREELVIEASQIAQKKNSNFFDELTDLTFKKALKPNLLPRKAVRFEIIFSLEARTEL